MKSISPAWLVVGSLLLFFVLFPANAQETVPFPDGSTEAVVPAGLRITTPDDFRKYVESIEISWPSWKYIPKSKVAFLPQGKCMNEVALWPKPTYVLRDLNKIVITLKDSKATLVFDSDYKTATVTDFHEQRTFKSLVRPQNKK